MDELVNIDYYSKDGNKKGIIIYAMNVQLDVIRLTMEYGMMLNVI